MVTTILFVVLLVFSAWGIGVGWRSMNLPGCEFRQTQTAVSAYFIQKENNFSLAYPTPVLGKPWSIPMEFPLYQWTVVGVSNGTGMALTQAGRAVSAVCFYLGLPAFYLLLGRLGLTHPRRLLALGFILSCPLYIYYARSFLIETMAVMFGAWFMLAYVRSVEQRNFGWLLLAAVTGVGCGLVKVTTFLFFLMPAFVWTLCWFRKDWQQSAEVRFRALTRRVLWCALAVALPFAASIWWVNYSDAIKARSVAGAFLQSGPMSAYNWGYGVRFSADVWRQHWEILFNEITSVTVLVSSGLIALFFARRWWGVILVLVGSFFVVQIMFPVLYAWHAYYYVANALALMLAFGLAVCGLCESRLPRWAVWLLVWGLYGMQAWSYLSFYYPDQKRIVMSGSNLTEALRRITAPDDVLVISGNDWSSMTPFYAQRRAYMVRQNLETTWSVILPAFEQLQGEDVTALVLHGDQSNNQMLIDSAARYFQIDPRPAFRWRDVTVLLHEQLRPQAPALLRDVPEIELLNPAASGENPLLRHEVEVAKVLPRLRTDFSQIKPTPFKYYATFDITQFEHEGGRVYGTHPDTRFWFKVAAGRHVFTAKAGLVPSAYGEVAYPDQSDGVEVRLEQEMPDGSKVLLFAKTINPRDSAADRGLLPIEQAFELPHDGVIVLSVGPGPQGNYARDWAVLGQIEIK